MSSENTSTEESNQQALAVSSTKSLSTRTIALASRGLQDLRVTEQAEQWLKTGLEFHLQQRHEDAFRCFECGAQLNPDHPGLQFMLGLSYDLGQGVPQDHSQAAVWYRRAADQGKAYAQHNLGYAYGHGEGVPQDYAQAVAWYRKAAEQGVSEAQCCLGNSYDFGQGVSQDDAQAAIWYHKAAEQGHARAQFNLGLVYYAGKCVTQDYLQAAAWYRKAAEQGHARAQFNIGYAYGHGEGVPQDFAQAAVWYRKAAEQGNSYAQYNLGFLYENGQGVPQDYEQAEHWYRKAAEQGNSSAQERLDFIAAMAVPSSSKEQLRKAMQVYLATPPEQRADALRNLPQSEQNPDPQQAMKAAEDKRHEAAFDKAALEFAKQMKGQVTVHGRQNDPLLKVANEVFAKSAKRKVN